VFSLSNKKTLYGIILLDELNTCGKFMQHLTKNIDRKSIDTNHYKKFGFRQRL